MALTIAYRNVVAATKGAKVKFPGLDVRVTKNKKKRLVVVENKTPFEPMESLFEYLQDRLSEAPAVTMNSLKGQNIRLHLTGVGTVLLGKQSWSMSDLEKGRVPKGEASQLVRRLLESTNVEDILHDDRVYCLASYSPVEENTIVVEYLCSNNKRDGRLFVGSLERAAGLVNHVVKMVPCII